MMAYYFVKQDLPGLPKGSVERFHLLRAAAHVSDGAIEPFDEKNKSHAAARAKQDRDAEELRAKEQSKLDKEFKRA